MKAAALALLGAALSIALPAASQAQNYDRNYGGPSINIPLPNLGSRHEQQALSPDRDHYRYCQDLRRRADDLRYDQSRARDREDFARARDRLGDIRDRLARDCGD